MLSFAFTIGGGAREIEVKEMKDRVGDALNANGAAVEQDTANGGSMGGMDF
jgi:chaperonin GroEL (HSP60 family)